MADPYRSDAIYIVANASAGDVPDDQFVAFFGNLDDAVAHRDDLRDDFLVYVAKPLPEWAHWDWAVGTPGHQPMTYVNEHAARNSVGGDGALYRRRRRQWGESGPWELVPHDCGGGGNG